MESPLPYIGCWKRPLSLSHNWKEQLGMAHRTDPAAVVGDQEKLIQGVAKHFLQKVYGLEAMPWGTKFSDLEELAVQIGQAVSRSMMDQALAHQAQNVPQGAETCGVCGAAVRSGPPPEPRAMVTTVGSVAWEEPKRYCPQCRAAFCPSVPESGD
jgi:hypothetical protein